MRIGLVTPYYPDYQTLNSGIANHFHLLANELSKLGNEVTILHIRPLYNNEKKDNDYLNSNGIRLITVKVSLPHWLNKILVKHWTIADFILKIKSIYVTWRSIQSIHKEYKLEIIETTSYLSLCFLSEYLKFNVPIINRVSTTFLQILNDHYTFKSRLLNLFGRLEIYVIKNGKHLITHTKTHALELEKIYNSDLKKFKIIPHGISIPPINELNIAPSFPLKILYIGRLEYRKGSDVLMKAIPLVLQAKPKLQFEIVGFDPDGSYENEFRSNNDKKVLEQVTFSGIKENEYVQKAYTNCHIFVAPSRYESFGLIYIESMSYQKPVIGCKVGGVVEIVEDGKNGILIEPNNHEALANKILLLANHENLRLELGTNARRTVEDKFSGKLLALNSVQYYKEVIQYYQ